MNNKISNRKLSLSSSSSMEDLPPSLISDILSRLTDPTDMGRCRVVSKTLNVLSHGVQSLNIVYPVYRLHRVVWEWEKVVTPFKEIVGKLISTTRCLESITIGPEKKLSKEFKRWGYSDDALEDLFFTKVGYLKNWLPSIGGNLKSLSLANFGPGCSWKKTDVLILISKCCNNLDELALKEAYPSTIGLNQMSKLTKLSLEKLHLDDENLLTEFNFYFPCLRVLNLKLVAGIIEPKIHHEKLQKFCLVDYYSSLPLKIYAPNLVELGLQFHEPRLVVLETPSLSNFQLIIMRSHLEEGFTRIKEFPCFPCLKRLELETASVFDLLGLFSNGTTIQMLALDSCLWQWHKLTGLSYEMLFEFFPNLSSLTLGPGAWTEMEAFFHTNGMEQRNGMELLKEINARVRVLEIDHTRSFINSILKKCSNILDMTLLLDHEVNSTVAGKLLSEYKADWPIITWKLGILNTGTGDTGWLCHNI